jgi:phosphoribosylformylglycinamidine synthase
MILFFKKDDTVYAVQATTEFSAEEISRLQWLFGGAEHLGAESLEGIFIGPRREMITPWSTNAVEITQNMASCGSRNSTKRRTKTPRSTRC